MEAQTLASRQSVRKRRYFPWISWGAIFGGIASGMATYLLLALLGIAAGLTALEPQAADPVGNVPLGALVWTGISMVLAAFVGGYVAARMSGLSRLADGIFHGLIAWGVSTLVFAYLITTSVGSMVGGAFGMIGQSLKVAGGAAVTAGGAAGAGGNQAQLESLLKGGSTGGSIDKESLQAVQQNLQRGDRDGAINVMVTQMGFTNERARQVVDQGMMLFGQAQQLPEKARDVAASSVSGLAKASWGLFIGVLLSLALGVGGGAIGSRATIRRTSGVPH